MSDFATPRLLTEADDCSGFSCSEQSLTNWLTLHAIKNQSLNTSRTFISIERESDLIAGYYCMSASALAHADAGASFRQNSPNPIPVILIGRLAVDTRFVGQGVGGSLLKHAVVKGLEANASVAAKAFLVHAISDGAAAFYARFGFAVMPGSERTMYLLMKDALTTIGSIAQTL